MPKVNNRGRFAKVWMLTRDLQHYTKEKDCMTGYLISCYIRISFDIFIIESFIVSSRLINSSMK